jgi:sec-independent protein translocase protein TatB
VVDLSPAKILVVLVVALVVLGPDKLPRVARQAGRLVNDFRRFRDGLNSEVREAFGDPSTLSNLQNLSSLSNLPARGRAWVTQVATGPLSSAPSGTPPAAPPPRGGSSPGPPPAGGPSPGHPPEDATPDGASPGSDGAFEARFN